MKDVLSKDGKQVAVTVEPIRGLPVEKDLVVGMEPVFDAFRAGKPFLIATGNEPTRERIQSQAGRACFDDTTKCILCACCTISCPVYWSDGRYFGPAPSSTRTGSSSTAVTRRRRASRHLNDVEDMWRCRTTVNCTDACPQHPGDEGDPAGQARAAVSSLISPGRPRRDRGCCPRAAAGRPWAPRRG
jgi:succinate dehydrogenase / fumarate reductase iron-sulfur subunit